MRHFDRTDQGGRKSQPPGYRYETTCYDQLQVIYITTGRLIFETGGADTVLQRGGVALLRETSAFSLRCERIGYRGIWWADYTRSVPAFRGSAAAFVADAGIHALAEMMLAEIRSPSLGSAELMNSIGRSLAWRAVRLAETGAANYDPRGAARFWAEAARQAVDANLYTGLGVREALSSLGMSYRQVSRHFTEIFGVAPKEYQVRARIAEAERLLATTSLPVTTVALELGYCSSQHFATQFQEATGRSPREYRAQAVKLG
ncbi:MAG: helix-turn-helix transcriptional regulator [Planctomycetes bacterium]|nr:helix-turn-helix transcriptional regulator [Planctomycetota bacterium]